MSDFLKMDPLAAVKWYANARGHFFGVDEIESLLAIGITDTDQLVEFGEGRVLDDLKNVPDMDPTPKNLRNLLLVGPDVMREDPDNVDDWAGLVGHPQVQSDPAETFGLFILAKRGPTFARQVLDLAERADKYLDIGDLDLTLPYSEIADMVENGITASTRKLWDEAGFDLADAIALLTSGLDLARITILKHHGVPRDQWATYVPIPMDWLDESYGRSGSRPRELPDGYDLDLLLTLAAKGWKRQRIEPGARRSNVYPNVWQVYVNDQIQTLTPEQIQRVMAAGMNSQTVTKYYMESRSGGGNNKAPMPLLPATKMTPDLDTLLGQWITLAEAGVRPSHLSEYRWAGCGSYQDILDAVAAGITTKRAKELREKHGRKTGYQVNDTKRIYTLTSLLTYHRGDEENDSSTTREDEKR